MFSLQAGNDQLQRIWLSNFYLSLSLFARLLGTELDNALRELILVGESVGNPGTVTWSAAFAGFMLYHGAPRRHAGKKKSINDDHWLHDHDKGLPRHGFLGCSLPPNYMALLIQSLILSACPCKRRDGQWVTSVTNENVGSRVEEISSTSVVYSCLGEWEITWV